MRRGGISSAPIQKVPVLDGVIRQMRTEPAADPLLDDDGRMLLLDDARIDIGLPQVHRAAGMFREERDQR